MTVFGAPSTRSLASFRPRAGTTSRTSLMTSIFFAPASVSTTSNSVFSSTAAAGAAPPPAAATATGAAAETPHFSSSIFASSAASRTVRAERSSTIFSRFAMVSIPVWFGC
ncbi:50S ribosomal protein L7/L12 [Hyphomonas polymorpha PS728]|uniref:50S ribosomal protein L7/L12 n=1 Tax=Hyphomonas polymorpha PS728 TaxID=1280954 RepID=A0A062VKY6_9PROT|nr:50S ribosomal protein L7/L12 [Hyphomonas polymorpha PS728]